MSRATTEAWYNSERIDRLKLVAAYLFLNGVVSLALSITVLFQAMRSASGPTTGEWVVMLAITITISIIWLYSAWLLWNARRAGAYWVLALTVPSIIRWVEHPLDFIALIFALIPATLIGMSWSALSAGKTRRAAD